MMTTDRTITELCEWAARMDAVIVCVHEPNHFFHDWIAQAHTPGNCRFHLPDYRYPLSADEQRILYDHVKSGGSVILLSPKAADDPKTLAHELGHVAVFLAGCDDADNRDSKPSQTLLRHAEQCGLDEFSQESNVELMAECVAWRMLDLPLSAKLHSFSNAPFAEFVRRTGWRSRSRWSQTGA
jgi:hypothetical protein